jgi:hypothetical protein
MTMRLFILSSRGVVLPTTFSPLRHSTRMLLNMLTKPPRRGCLPVVVMRQCKLISANRSGAQYPRMVTMYSSAQLVKREGAVVRVRVNPINSQRCLCHHGTHVSWCHHGIQVRGENGAGQLHSTSDQYGRHLAW